MNANGEISQRGTFWMLCPTFLLCVAIGTATPETLLQEGDAFEAKMQTKEALERYLAVEKTKPQDAAVLVRIARQYRHLMNDTSSVAEKMKYANLALNYGKRAAAAAPGDSDAVLSTAITYGRMVKYLPKKEQVATSKVIKASAERAVKLDPKNDLAWHVLGRWHRVASEVGGMKRALAGMIYEKLPPSSYQESAKCLENAVKLKPDRLMHQIELGKTYAQMGRTAEARRHLLKGLSMPGKEKDDPAMKQTGREALALLQ
jgi:tetratricopeptide (TPR) repeat protein